MYALHVEVQEPLRGRTTCLLLKQVEEITLLLALFNAFERWLFGTRSVQIPIHQQNMIARDV